MNATEGNVSDVSHHVLITGTGRAGTTLIMLLLSKLGLNTGYTAETAENSIFENCHAGLEKPLTMSELETMPYILKSPLYSSAFAGIVKNKNIQIDRVYIPIRNIEQAAKSRVHVSEKSNSNDYEGIVPGGLWDAETQEEQVAVLSAKLINLLISLSQTHIPFKFIHYPLLTRNSRYLYRKLMPLLKDIPYPEFKKVFDETVDPKLVNLYK